MTTINIKCTSKMSKGLQLNGNTLSGDTYGMREYIKTHWSGKWDGATKTWTVDGAKVVEMIQAKEWGFCKVLEITNETPANVKTNKTDMQRGIWQRNGELTEDF